MRERIPSVASKRITSGSARAGREKHRVDRHTVGGGHHRISPDRARERIATTLGQRFMTALPLLRN
jgi:hypothetical protein